MQERLETVERERGCESQVQGGEEDPTDAKANPSRTSPPLRGNPGTKTTTDTGGRVLEPRAEGHVSSTRLL